MQIINPIHTKQEKFMYIVLNDHSFPELFIQKPLSSWKYSYIFSKNSNKVMWNFEKSNYVQSKFILLDIFTKKHHKDVSQDDKIHKKYYIIHVNSSKSSQTMWIFAQENLYVSKV